MKKQAVDEYKKPGFLSRIFKRKEKKHLEMMGDVPADTLDDKRHLEFRGKVPAVTLDDDTDDDGEIIELEGDVCAPIEDRLMGEVPIQTEDREDEEQ